MSNRGRALLRIAGAALAVLALVGLSAATLPFVKNLWKPAVGAQGSDAKRADALESHNPHTIRLPSEVVEKLGIQTTEARAATQPRPLPPLAGQLSMDITRFSRVHARFAGEVVVVALVPDRDEGKTVPRLLRPGDWVQKDQLLAVVWSKDVGEKKSELVDALSQLRHDEEFLQRLTKSYEKGGIPEQTIREAERRVEADRIAAAKAERTLRVWRLTDSEISAIKSEVDRLRRRKEQPNHQQEWARVEVRAPRAVTILEMNTNVGDIVDTTADLFKIVDLSRLSVWVNAPEDDLPALQSLPRPIQWTIRLKNDPAVRPFRGAVERISDIIDPSQHTALIVGSVDNTEGRLKIGQFVTATIEVPASPDEVTIPATALLEDGRQSLILVQEDPQKPTYTLRRVVVVRRQHDAVFVRSKLSGREPSPSAPDSLSPRALLPGERVVVAGAVELKAALDEQRSSSAVAHTNH